MARKQKFIDNEGRLVAEMTEEEITEAVLEIDDIGRRYALGVMPYKEAVSRLSKINPFNLAMAYISLLEMYQKQVAHEEKPERARLKESIGD